MSATELRVTITLALIYFLRMLPLFMLLPVLTLAGNQYPDASPQLLGIALGIYGLTQAGLQIPLGMLSDRFGRKPIIVAGLCLFIIGSLLAAISTSVYELILGRTLQGAGAVAAAIMALAADLTRPQVRTKTMACIGISIGIAFSIAFILGPFLYTKIGLSGLFYVGIGLALLAIVLLLTGLPQSESNKQPSALKLIDLKSALSDPNLRPFYWSILITHFILMANFVVIPITLQDVIALTVSSHWQVYLSAMLASLLIMLPFMIFGEKLNKTRLFFISSIALMLLSQLGFIVLHSTLTFLIIIVFLSIFFGAFNYLEALLPSTLSKKADPNKKGTALGIYATLQFIGMFLGGTLGGYLHQSVNITSVHWLCLILASLWLASAILNKTKWDLK